MLKEYLMYCSHPCDQKETDFHKMYIAVCLTGKVDYNDPFSQKCPVFPPCHMPCHVICDVL